MSSLKRSKPEEQDAILKRLQELSSSSRLEMDVNDEVSRSKSPLPSSRSSSDHIRSDHTREDQESRNEADSHLPKSNIPDLKITPEIDDDSNSNSVSSSANSSVKIPTNKQRAAKVSLQSLPHSPISVRLCSPHPPSPHPLSPNPLSSHPPSPHLSPHPSSPPRFRGCSPKAFRRFEFWPDSLSPSSSSPTSPSRKFFRLPGSPSPFAGGVGRGSEPVLDGVSRKDGNEDTKSTIADKRWEKLRSVLVAMKEDPFDVDSIAKLSPLATPSSPKVTLSDTQEELYEMKIELSELRTKMRLKENHLQEALDERSMTLAYLRDRQLLPRDENRNVLSSHYKNGATSRDGIIQSNSDKKKTGSDDDISRRHVDYSHQLEVLNQESSTKEEVLAVLGQALGEWTRDRSFLDDLMTLTLASAPWMVDEVMGKGDWRKRELTDTDLELSDEDFCDEVWC